MGETLLSPGTSPQLVLGMEWRAPALASLFILGAVLGVEVPDYQTPVPWGQHVVALYLHPLLLALKSPGAKADCCLRDSAWIFCYSSSLN